MATMKIQITGDRLASTTNTQITSQVRGAGSALVPGVLSWDSVATRTVSGTQSRISATITTEDVVSSGDYTGTEVTPEFVCSYITGAAEWWLGTDGDMFLPHEAVILPSQLAAVASDAPTGENPTA